MPNKIMDDTSDLSKQSSEKTFSVRKLARQHGFDERDRNQKRSAFDIAASRNNMRISNGR
jgi:hypothetical protein